MILSKEEMEEVVMKKCWLARYWGLAVKYGNSKDGNLFFLQQLQQNTGYM